MIIVAAFLLLPIMQMDGGTNEFVVSVCMNLWLWVSLMQLFPNI